LDSLREEYIVYKEERQRLMNGNGIETKKKSVVKKLVKSSKKVLIEE
jgi:hypothetical protein